jgi:hypothetical protein
VILRLLAVVVLGSAFSNLAAAYGSLTPEAQQPAPEMSHLRRTWYGTREAVPTDFSTLRLRVKQRRRGLILFAKPGAGVF